MSAWSARETAARAADESPALGCGCCADPAEDTDFDVEPGWRQVALADAVLAAVADHDGLAGVLAGHSPVLSSHPTTHIVCCAGCEWVAPDANSLWPEFAAHLADVVRAWLRGES